ncbi:hypothetical protein GCK72_024031 [Caenorhabditis remanei]|uniref:C2H2-type domain-containing protein n=1 Tax=Caenorhabditis remanei TaxID=31234 RepID=A0A6A5FY75_CAERE|nr:hypothetical protein GCK72_024031 [Caenorhabditis remanei]KAF1747566.1 hypothetical protein GCK72_024031 [Caenorhabditis remanei]
MMSSNESLGNDLLFPDDPFISGVAFIHDNDNMFEDLFKDTLLFDQEMNNAMPIVNEEPTVELMEEDSLFNTMNLHDTVGIYGFNPLDSFDPFSTTTHDLLFSEERMNSQMNTVFDSQPGISTNVTPENVASVEVPEKIVDTVETLHQEDQKVAENNNYEFEQDHTAPTPAVTVAKTTTTISKSAVKNNIPTKISRISSSQPSKLAAAFRNVKKIPYSTPTYVAYQQPAYKPTIPANGQTKTLYPVKVLPVMSKKQLPVRPVLSLDQMRKKIANRNPLYFPESQNQGTQAQPLENTDSNVPEPENKPICEENAKTGFDNDQVEVSVSTVGSVLKQANTFWKMSTFVPRDIASNFIKCNYCKQAFTTKLALEFHEVERHPYVFAFRCTLCDEIYSTIQMNNAIFGNDQNNESHLRNANRRISGMVWSFLSSYLQKTGKITGTAVEDRETIKLHARALFHSSAAKAINDNCNQTSPGHQSPADTATINDLLKITYIYGPFISRLRVDCMPADKVLHFSEPEMFEPEEDKQSKPTVPMVVFPPKKTIVFHPPPKAAAYKKTDYTLPPLQSQNLALIKEKKIPVFMPTTIVRPLTGNKKIKYQGTVKGQQVFKVKKIVKSQMPALVRRIDYSPSSLS